MLISTMHAVGRHAWRGGGGQEEKGITIVERTLFVGKEKRSTETIIIMNIRTYCTHFNVFKVINFSVC